VTFRAKIYNRVTTATARYGNQDRYRTGTAAILAQKAARSSFKYLWDAEVSVYSQFGEDGVLDYLCDSLDLPKPRAIEFGAGNFLQCNTRFLAEYRGASVFAVDARNDLRSTVERLPAYWRTTIEVHQGWITPRTAPDLLLQAKEKFGGIDIVSLDIDGNDYWVADRLDLQGVSIVVVEYNSLLSRTQPVSVPRNDSFDRTEAHFSWLYFGATLHAFVELFSRSDLLLVGVNRVGNNAFFVPKDRLPEIPLSLVQPKDYQLFTDWRVRESRNEKRRLSFVSGRERIDLIGGLPVINTLSGDTSTVYSANGLATPGT
jgi:hypothetical protein